MSTTWTTRATVSKMHILFAFFVSVCYSLVCNQGTNSANSAITCPNVGDSCISAFFSTGGLPSWNISQIEGTGTPVYACGNCSFFQSDLNNTVVHTVSCCNSDLCNTITGALPPAGSCDSITTLDTCINQTGCYWCDSFVNNSFGLCKSLYPPAFAAPCFIQAMFSPPPICSAINCPPVVPAYSSNITLDELTTFGFPPVPPALQPQLSLQLYYAEVKYLSLENESYFCDVDLVLQNWCGLSVEVWPNAFQYCIVSETWPQNDMQGWMENTTFSSNRGVQDVFYPVICMCHLPTSLSERPRAFFVPTDLYPTFYYGPTCGEEHAMLAMYLLLMLFCLILLLLVIYDTILLVSLTFTQKRELGTKTIFVKIALITYFIVTLICMAMFVAPEKEGDGQRSSVRIVFKLIGLISLLMSFTISVFTYVEIVLVSRIFGKHKGKKTALKIFSYFFFIFHGIILLADLALLAAVCYFVQQLNGTLPVSNLTEISKAADNLAGTVKTLMVTLCVAEGSMTFISAILIFYICYIILDKAENLKKQRSIQAIFVRAVALVVALIASIPCLGILATQVFIFGWVGTNSVPEIWPTEYRHNMGVQWLFWASFATELMWISAIAYSMSTVVKRSLIHQAIAAYMGFTIATGSSTSSGTSSRGTRSQRGQDSIDSGIM